MELLFLGTGASDWNGPDERGEYRRHASALLDNSLLIDVTKSVLDMIPEKTLSTLIQTNETYESTQIDAFFESKPKIDAFLKIDANVQRQEYKMAS